jgi:hypothetical protein
VLRASDIGRNRRAACGAARVGEQPARGASSNLQKRARTHVGSLHGFMRERSGIVLYVWFQELDGQTHPDPGVSSRWRVASQNGSRPPTRFGVAGVTRVWVTKLITANRAEKAGRWLCVRGSKGPRRTSRGGEDEGKHHWASGANRKPTRSVHNFGRGRALHGLLRGTAFRGREAG